jgi:hypothetical protein
MSRRTLLPRVSAAALFFLDYAFDKDKKAFPGPRIRHLLPCAAIRTPDGQSGAMITSLAVDTNKNPSVAWFSFLSRREGKPLISHYEEKVEFRFIADQRVFETTFAVNPSDLFDGSEQVVFIPPTVDQPSSAVNEGYSR